MPRVAGHFFLAAAVGFRFALLRPSYFASRASPRRARRLACRLQRGAPTFGARQQDTRGVPRPTHCRCDQRQQRSKLHLRTLLLIGSQVSCHSLTCRARREGHRARKVPELAQSGRGNLHGCRIDPAVHSGRHDAVARLVGEQPSLLRLPEVEAVAALEMRHDEVERPSSFAPRRYMPVITVSPGSAGSTCLLLIVLPSLSRNVTG